jgi:arabinogalactan endo-1,4-beta-galactosidase
VISGTPTAAGTSNVSISATNSGGTGSATLVLTINASGGGRKIAFSNQGFESDESQTPSGWSTWANTVANEAADYVDAWEPRSGSRHLSHWLPSGTYQVYTYRTLTGLTNSTYTVRAWTKSTGGQTGANMTVKNCGGAQLTSTIPASESTYTERVISGVQVTNGQLEVGFWSNTSADGQWIAVDDVSVTRN